ncbi:hypothetical protein [Streptomyces anthocyanicus]|uniref:hypothetical protein n=1 Tax=Streptomyces anthocyanicus TaxID=68174 RepID=UPI0038677D27|nr:hypothetical protein OH747_05685 [Streptomyces anthocyanicus]
MTINHRAEAERIVHGVLNNPEYPNFEEGSGGEKLILAGLLHATLARDEEQAARTADLKEALQSLRRRFNDTRSLVATHIADGLVSREKARWQAARDLSQALDEAHCNVDDLVDARLSDDGWDPRSAYKAPASAVRSDDPWAPKPDITAEIPEPVRRLFAEHIAQMLLNGDSETTQLWARNFTFALKNEGADLTADIEKRITDLTLGADPSDPPF